MLRRYRIIMLAALPLLVLVGPADTAQTKLEATDIANHPFSAEFVSGGKVRVYTRSGEIHIVGGDENKISVELSGTRASEAGSLKVRLERSGNSADLDISGGPRNDLTITIRLPKNTDLFARIPAGEVHVEHLIGNKDVELHSGELDISIGETADYAHVDASVLTGGLEGEPYGESHGGLFRSFHKEGPGKYRLHAHVGAGQLTLQR
jgi:hypothetical protein